VGDSALMYKAPACTPARTFAAGMPSRGAAGPQRVADRQHRAHLAVPAHRDRDLAGLAGPVHGGGEPGGHLEPGVSEESRPPDSDRTALDQARTPAPATLVNPVTAGGGPQRRAASIVIAWPAGCSGAASTAPAMITFPDLRAAKSDEIAGQHARSFRGDGHPGGCSWPVPRTSICGLADRRLRSTRPIASTRCRDVVVSGG
jgi:hypothetical protein